MLLSVSSISYTIIPKHRQRKRNGLSEKQWEILCRRAGNFRVSSKKLPVLLSVYPLICMALRRRSDFSCASNKCLKRGALFSLFLPDAFGRLRAIPKKRGNSQRIITHLRSNDNICIPNPRWSAISLDTGSGTLRPALGAFLRPFIRKRHEGESKKITGSPCGDPVIGTP